MRIFVVKWDAWHEIIPVAGTQGGYSEVTDPELIHRLEQLSANAGPISFDRSTGYTVYHLRGEPSQEYKHD